MFKLEMPILPSALDKAFIDLVAHSDFGGSIDDRGMDCLWISNLLCPKLNTGRVLCESPPPMVTVLVVLQLWMPIHNIGVGPLVVREIPL